MTQQERYSPHRRVLAMTVAEQTPSFRRTQQSGLGGGTRGPTHSHATPSNLGAGRREARTGPPRSPPGRPREAPAPSPAPPSASGPSFQLEIRSLAPGGWSTPRCAESAPHPIEGIGAAPEEQLDVHSSMQGRCRRCLASSRCSVKEDVGLSQGFRSRRSHHGGRVTSVRTLSRTSMVSPIANGQDSEQTRPPRTHEGFEEW